MTPRIVRASAWAISLLLWGSTWHFAFAAAPTHTLEIRRTFASIHCDTGELYIDGRLRGLFLTSPDLIPGLIKTASLRETLISTSETSLVGRYGQAIKRKGLSFNSTRSAPAFLQASLLDSDSYSPFVSPRKKLPPLPAGAMLIGSTVENRLCAVSAPGTMQNDDPQPAIASATDMFASQLFDAKISLANFHLGMEQLVLIVFSDKSKKFELKFGPINFQLASPVRAADEISDGDDCLVPWEHGRNTVIRNTTTSYKRVDDVWTCTNGKMIGVPGGRGMEIRRDIGLIEVWAGGAPCATVFGLPIQTTYRITRKDDGRAAQAFTRCASDQPWEKIALPAEISQ